MLKPAIFLDRDGTINVDNGYTYRVEDLEFEQGAVEGLKVLANLPYLLIVTTGQSGIEKGYYSESDFHVFMKHLKDQLAAHSIKFDAIYFCPHESTSACKCRKPQVGMISQAVEDLAAEGITIDLENSFVIGDKTDDGKLGNNIGCQSILVRQGKKGLDGNHECSWSYQAEDLLDAALWIRKQAEDSLRQ